MAKSDEVSKKVLEVLPPLVHRIRVMAKASMKDGLTLPQFRILTYVQRGVRNVGEIADLQSVAQPTISKMVDGLVRKGLLKRSMGKEDRRQILLDLTKKGEKVSGEGLVQIRSEMTEKLDKLKSEEREILDKSLDHLKNLLLKSLVD